MHTEKGKRMTDYSIVTEVSGEKVSNEQIYRMQHRYSWVSDFCTDKNVFELACGSGQGISILLSAKPKLLTVSDIMESFIQNIQHKYGSAVVATSKPYEKIKFKDNSLDVIILFEAIYYIESIEEFFEFCKRKLKKGGQLFIVTTNKDLYDFTPSKFSRRYVGVCELDKQLSSLSFKTKFYGFFEINKLSVYNVVFRPLKFFATRFKLVPSTMSGKEFLKSIVFGKLTEMPEKLEAISGLAQMSEVSARKPCKSHKVIYCRATKI